MIGLHNSVIVSEDSKLGYDGTKYPREEWNKNLSLKEAFETSCVWYFRKLLDQVGQEEVQQELNALKYGNCDTSEWYGSAINPISELNGFWLESSLQISPMEQVELLYNIMNEKTMYTKNEVSVLKNIMQVESSGTRTLYGKTGTGVNHNGWFIGFMETEHDTIYFAVYLQDESADNVDGRTAKEVAETLLEY